MKKGNSILKAASIETILGSMIAVSDDDSLYLLEFSDYYRLEREMKWLTQVMKAEITWGETIITQKIKKELINYFEGKQFIFKTPIKLMGTPFQNKVWTALQEIPPGETRSYLNIAKSIQHPSAFRAVANANGANQLAIIIPCHRVINSNGDLGGYAGGVSRKEWLLQHEKRIE